MQDDTRAAHLVNPLGPDPPAKQVGQRATLDPHEGRQHRQRGIGRILWQRHASSLCGASAEAEACVHLCKPCQSARPLRYAMQYVVERQAADRGQVARIGSDQAAVIAQKTLERLTERQLGPGGNEIARCDVKIRQQRVSERKNPLLIGTPARLHNRDPHRLRQLRRQGGRNRPDIDRVADHGAGSQRLTHDELATPG